MFSCEVEQNHHGQTRDDVFLCIPPLYHTGAKMHWFGSFLAGSKSVLLKGTKPEYILSAVSEEKCTVVWLLVPWAQDILQALDSGELKLSDYELSQWRLMHIGAQPVPQSLIKRWLEYFPNHQYDTNYGLSESIGPGCMHLGIENVHKVGSIGRAGYGWESKIVDDKGEPVKPGEVGELCVKGPGVMVCYFHNEAATKEVLKDGWLFTGDMAREDEDGFVYLVDRKKDVIITGGENIYPVQIEDFLSTHPKVKDVAVIGLPDHRLGEISAAIIEVKKGMACTEEEINEFCLGLPRYKRPHKIIFANVPRNPTGKIEKPKLRATYGASSLVDMQNKS
jgi:acyl-CoA synthetase (AMP-forming)/AMP-acid ligase II